MTYVPSLVILEDEIAGDVGTDLRGDESDRGAHPVAVDGHVFLDHRPALTGSGGRAAGFGASLHPVADSTTAEISKARTHMLETRMLAGVYFIPRSQ